jgi:hypothetical protein
MLIHMDSPELRQVKLAYGSNDTAGPIQVVLKDGKGWRGRQLSDVEEAIAKLNASSVFMEFRDIEELGSFVSQLESQVRDIMMQADGTINAYWAAEKEEVA